MRRIVAAVTVAITCLAGVSFVAEPLPAIAASKPTATFTPIHRSITAGTAPAFAVSLKHVPYGTKTYLQRQYGSSHVWKNVARIYHATGTVSGAELGRGLFYFRIHGTRKGKSVETSVGHFIFSFGTVPFSNLCAFLKGECSPNTEQVGDQVFTYVLGFYGNSYPNFDSVFSFPKTSCRSLNLSFAYNNPNDKGQITYLKVVQSTNDPVVASSPRDVIGHLSVQLDGGPFIVDNAVANGSDITAINGSASCYTTSGAR